MCTILQYNTFLNTRAHVSTLLLSSSFHFTSFQLLIIFSIVAMKVALQVNAILAERIIHKCFDYEDCKDVQ